MVLTSTFHSNYLNSAALDRCNHTLTWDLDNKVLCFQYHKTNINILWQFFFLKCQLKRRIQFCKTFILFFPFQFIPRISFVIPRFPAFPPWFPIIPTLIPRIPTLIPRIPIIPFIPLPDSTFRFLQAAESNLM